MHRCTNELGKTKVFYVVKDIFFLLFFFIVPVVCCPPCKYVKVYKHILYVINSVVHSGTPGISLVV